MGLLVAILLALQAEEIEPALRKGIEAIRTRMAGLDEGREFTVWTLVSLGLKEDDRSVAPVLKDLLQRPPESTSSAALQAMIFRDLDRLKYRSRIAHCAQYLIDNQTSDGRWDRGTPVNPPEFPTRFPIRRDKWVGFGSEPPPLPERVILKRTREGAKIGNDVDARWAIWGLQACTESGFAAPAVTLHVAAQGWKTGTHDAADVVSCLSVCDYQLFRNWKSDPDIRAALMRLLEANPPTDPKSLFVLRRAMVHYGSERLGDRDWWRDGVRQLLASQRDDGTWGGIEDSCAALYFLHVPRHPMLVQPDRLK